MENRSSDMFKALPHFLESWLNITLNMTSQLNYGFVGSLSVYSGEWFDYSIDYMQSLGRGVNTFSVSWTLSIMLIFALFMYLCVGYFPAQKRLRILTSNIPGPLAFPIVGNIPIFVGCNLVQFFQKLTAILNKYGPIVRFWIGNKLYIVVADAESIDNLLTSKGTVTDTSGLSKLFSDIGVTLANNGKWKIHRKIISSTFNSTVLDQFMGNFAENSLVLIEKLKPLADGSTVDIYPCICACTIDIVCETVMGVNISNHMEGDGVFMTNLLRALEEEEELEGPLKKPWMLREWIQNRRKECGDGEGRFVKYLLEFVDKVVTEKLECRRDGFEEKRGKRPVEYLQWVRGKEKCLLDLLIQDDQLSVEDIKEELSTLIVAGTKVTAVTCCFAVSLLGVYQDVQHAVMQEQEKIFGGDIHRSATSKDLSGMEYLEQVIKETLRLYPPVPFLFRKIEEDTKLENGYVLPKESCAVIFSYMTHRNSEYYPHPELFDPERFAGNNHPYGYIPFGGGRGICVAYKYGMMEVKAVLSAVIRAYRVTTPGGVESLDRNLKAGVLLTPAKGFNVQMLPRSAKVLPSVFREG